MDASAAVTAAWMRVGFVHGVLSTDNVLVSGETIDYGPCAFLDEYEPGVWFSSIDQSWRYAYDNQPAIMRWNLDRLGIALAPLLDDDPVVGERVAAQAVSAFPAAYLAQWAAAFREILDSFTPVITLQRGILALSAEASDEGTNSLMSDYIRAQEKLVWMYSAYLNK